MSYITGYDDCVVLHVPSMYNLAPSITPKEGFPAGDSTPISSSALAISLYKHHPARPCINSWKKHSLEEVLEGTRQDGAASRDGTGPLGGELAPCDRLEAHCR